MPPKKKPAGPENGDTKVSAFRWTLENEKRLLILTQGRYLTGEDYERVVSVFPGTTVKGVQVRVSLLRVEQRKLFDEYGWTLPDGGAVLKKSGTPAKKAGTPRKTGAGKKRGVDAVDADEDEDGAGEEMGTPSKKARAGKAEAKAEKEEVVEEDIEGEDGRESRGKSVRVKEEVFDDVFDEMV